MISRTTRKRPTSATKKIFISEKLATKLWFSGGAWAENTTQQDVASAIVNRVLTEDTSGSADVIIISNERL